MLVSHDHRFAVPTKGIATTLQAALESWQECEASLRNLSDALDAGEAGDIIPFDAACAMAPLPRAWQWLDGSGFPSNGALREKAFKVTPLKGDLPLMDQGKTYRVLSRTEEVTF